MAGEASLGEAVVATVAFALGSAEVIVLSSHRVADGDIVYHVADAVTGHQDFVGSRHIQAS